MPEQLQPFAFKGENARRASAKGVAARLKLIAQAKAIVEADRARPTGPPAIDKAVTAQLNLVAEQITRTRKVLNSEEVEHHHRAQLLKALDSLLDRQRELLGIPRTGSRRPGPDKPARRQTYVEPVPSQPSASDTPSSGVPVSDNASSQHKSVTNSDSTYSI